MLYINSIDLVIISWALTPYIVWNPSINLFTLLSSGVLNFLLISFCFFAVIGTFISVKDFNTVSSSMPPFKYLNNSFPSLGLYAIISNKSSIEELGSTKVVSFCLWRSTISLEYLYQSLLEAASPNTCS